MSPYADLTLAGATMDTRREVDPLLSREALQARVPDYTSGQDAALALVSPVFADLSGMPPLIIQAGTHEVLLDDAVRLAQEAVNADVEVTLDITPGVPTSSRRYYPILDEAGAALDRAGQSSRRISPMHRTDSGRGRGPPRDPRAVRRLRPLRRPPRRRRSEGALHRRHPLRGLHGRRRQRADVRARRTRSAHAGVRRPESLRSDDALQRTEHRSRSTATAPRARATRSPTTSSPKTATARS